MTILCDLATAHDTDKAPWGWNYTPVYNDWLPYCSDIKTIVEVGVWKGSSLRMWRDAFPFATVLGIDNDPNCMVETEDRMRSICRDAYDDVTLKAVLESLERNIDLFVDDARHFAEYQAQLLKSAWPYIAPGGVYAIEETFPWEALHDTIAALPHVARCENIRTMSPSRRWDIISGRYSLTLIRKKR